MAPVKKKYSTNQVAAITIITLLKGIYSLDSLQSAFAQLEINDYPQAVYNRFVDLFNALLRGDKFPEASSIAKVNERLLQLAAHDAYDHLLASQLLKEMQSVQTPAELKH